jgi:hypothetical protein
MSRMWWGLPGPAGFIDELEHDLREGRSVVLTLPAGPPDGLRDALAERVRVADCWGWRRLDLAEEEGALPPPQLLHDHFSPLAAGDAGPSAKSLAQARRFRGQVVWVHGVTPAAWPAWREFLAAYESATRAYSDGDPARVVVPLLGASTRQAPAEGVALSVRQLLGISTRLDMMLYVSLLIRDRAIAPLYRRLAVSVVTELAGTDAGLARHLCELPPQVLFDPTATLRGVARSRGWPERPPPMGLWELGLEDRLEGQRFVHSAALALWGQGEEVARRVWRGEVGILFPFIEEHRTRLVDSLNGHLRVPVETPFGPITDKRDLEIGHILFQLGRANIQGEVRQFVSRLTTMRHALAHLEVVGAEHLFSPEVQRRAQ